MSAPLISVEDLVDHMSGVSLTEGQRRAAERVIAGVQRNLERRLNRRFGVEEVTETVVPSAGGRAVLSRRPFRGWVGLAPVAQGWSYDVHPDGWLDFGQPRLTAGLTPMVAAPELVCRYLGGDEFPQDDLDDVVLAILEKCAQLMTNRHDDAKSVKGFDTRDTSITAAQMRWTDEEVGDLARMKRRVLYR